MDSEGVLNLDTGCLTDSDSIKNPFLHPSCWIGWRKSIVKEPFILLKLTRTSVVNGIHLTTYVNQSAGVSQIKRFVVNSGITLSPVYTFQGEACAPDSAYRKDQDIVTYVINLDNLKLQYLKINFLYSGNWMLLRKVDILQGKCWPVKSEKRFNI